MEIEDPVPPGKQCIEIDGTMKCFDMNPTKEKNCTMLNNVAFCENGEGPATFREERKKFFSILFYPKLRKGEAKEMESNVIYFTVGLILSSIVFTLSLYIKDIVDLIAFYFLPSTMTLLSLVFIIVILIGISLLLSFVQTRLVSAVEETEVLEKLSEKDPAEVLQTLIE